MVAILLAPLVADATRGTRHVHTEVWAELKDLLEVSGLAELVSPELLEDVAMDDGDTEAFVHLKNRNILLYTLVPGAAERASEFIKGVSPSSRIVTDNSHVGGPQLREKVRHADMVVIASRAAKHAAANFIRQESPGAVLWSAGKGWSSFVEALRLSANPA